MSGATSWSFHQDDYQAIVRQLDGLREAANLRSVLLVDRAGQMIASVGEPPRFDPQAFASLTAADFSANDQLAKMIGEEEFSSLFHQGQRESMYLADVARRVILVALFDNRTTLGLVRLRTRAAVEDLAKLFEVMFNRVGSTSPQLEAGFGGAADAEIERLFGS